MATQRAGAATRKAEAATGRSNGTPQGGGSVSRPAPAPEPPPHVDPPASWFPLLEKEQMDPDVRALLEKAAERVGFCPNVFRAWAWRPSRFLKWFAHYNELMTGPSGLSRADREMIAVAVSMQNRCLYCLTSHGSTLRTLTGDPVLADRITLDYRRAGLEPRERAMLDYAVKITREMAECSAEDVAALKQLGFSEEDVWDIAEVASMFNFTNRLAAATGQLPNPEYHGMAR